MALAAILVCFLAAVVTALVIVPPWQNPDEPQHLQTVRLVLRHGTDFNVDSYYNDPSERAIVESMARYRWWEHYGKQTPNPLPATFADGPSKVVAAYFGPPGGGSRLYYSGVAALFRAADVTELLPQLYLMRCLSALWGLLTIACAWAGTRVLLGHRSAVVVAAMMALHPQFALVATSASPDAFVNLAAGVVWWQSAHLLTSAPRALDAAMLLAAAVLGFLTRRMGATLIVMAAAVIAAAFIRTAAARQWRFRIGWAVATSIAVIVLAGTAWSAAPADVHRAAEWIRFNPLRSASTLVATADHLPAAFEMLFTTFWLSAGWLQYRGPAWWQAATVVLTVLAGLGVFASLEKTPSTRPAIWLAGGMLLLQVAAVAAYYFGIVQSGAQGRYLFPVLPAVFCLVWVGWRGIFAERQSLAAVSLLTVMGFLSVSAWTFVIFPAYA